MSSGDPAARVVVDLASFQPLENGLSNQSIYSVRLQQMCPAKKRRRFLRRGNARPPGSPATNHIRKDAILVIGGLASPACMSHAQPGLQFQPLRNDRARPLQVWIV